MDSFNAMAREPWQQRLEIIGAPMFQRYRKQLMSPGIIREIRRACPGLSLFTVWIRVQAGRRIIEDGEEFLALEAIHSGRWERQLRARAASGSHDEVRRDRLSRQMVRLGGMLFAFYGAATLGASIGWPGTLMIVAVAALAIRGRLVGRVRPIGQGARNGVTAA